MADLVKKYNGGLDIQAPEGVKANGSLVVTELSEKQIGVGQSWQDFTSSRAYGVTYTNTSGKPITLAIEAVRGGVSSAGIGVSVDGGVQIDFCHNTNSSGGNRAAGTFIIPDGSTYQVNDAAEATTIVAWWELR